MTTTLEILAGIVAVAVALFIVARFGMEMMIALGMAAFGLFLLSPAVLEMFHHHVHTAENANGTLVLALIGMICFVPLLITMNSPARS